MRNTIMSVSLLSAFTNGLDYLFRPTFGRYVKGTMSKLRLSRLRVENLAQAIFQTYVFL